MRQSLPRLLVLAGLLAVAACASPPEAPQRESGWMTAPQTAAADEANTPIALQFRRDVTLAQVPARLPVRVSADNRFVLFVNGRRVADGPSRGDRAHWRYETIDLAPHLVTGANVIAAQIWNDGSFAALAQITGGRTAFYIEAADPAQSALIGTSADWRVRVDESRAVTMRGMAQIIQQAGGGFYAAGPPETIRAEHIAHGWAERGAILDDWSSATPLQSRPFELTLVEDRLPQMRYEQIPSGRVVRSNGVSASRFPEGPVEIAANSEASILVDAGRVIAAYPVLVTSGGAGSEIEITYVEALYDPAVTAGITNEFGSNQLTRYRDRARVDNGLARGLSDTMYPDGGAERRLAPYWWRGWRFAEITVKTGAQPLTLERFETHLTGYPFEQRGRFVSSDAELNRIWQVGWDTALFDAHETYMDTAYWEQLQYIGDTRIQMLLSYDVAGDNRLAIQALDAVDASRWNAGLPQSAWPETNDNVIPPFALLWIGSLHDYWMRQPDVSVIQRNLAGTREILGWYAQNLSERGLVQESSGWPFVDWVGHLSGWQWRGGTGPEHCVISMIYYGALREAADLETAVGDAALAPGYRERAARVRDALNSHCWDARRALYADLPTREDFSQHAAILAVLYDLVPADQQRAMLERVTTRTGGIAAPEGITGVTYYFSFYLARAFEHAGMRDRYIGMLTPWRAMLAQNFTTFPETPDPSRSDTHAWSGHPTSGMLTYIAGIRTDAPGFARVRIAPELGDLRSLDAAMTHPLGLIETRYEANRSGLSARIVLPAGLSGVFEWRGRSVALNEGINEVSLRR